MTPPSLETAREILADAAAKARAGGEPFAEIAASAQVGGGRATITMAVDVQADPVPAPPAATAHGTAIPTDALASDMLPCPFCRSTQLVVGPAGSQFPRVTCGECGTRGPLARSLNDREAIANWNRRQGPQRSADPAPAGPAGGDHAGGAESSRPAAPDPCLRRSALALLEAAKEIGSKIERVVNGWEGHEPGDVTERVRATLACWSDEERAAALGVLLDPRAPERGTRARRAVSATGLTVEDELVALWKILEKGVVLP